MFDKSETKIVYAYDENNRYSGEKILDYTDRSQASGDWQLPWGCVDLEPPAAKDSYDIYWQDEYWVYRKISIPAIDTEPTLQELKEKKIFEFKMCRDSEEVALLEYKNKAFDYDSKSRERMRIAEKSLVDNNIANQTWTCADNTQIELNVQDFKNLNSLAAQRSGELHNKYNQLKIQINNINSKEALIPITW